MSDLTIGFHSGYDGVYGFVAAVDEPPATQYRELVRKIGTRAEFERLRDEWKAKYPGATYHSTLLIFDFPDWEEEVGRRIDAMFAERRGHRAEQARWLKANRARMRAARERHGGPKREYR